MEDSRDISLIIWANHIRSGHMFERLALSIECSPSYLKSHLRIRVHVFSLNSKCFYLQVRAIEGLTGCAPLKHAIRFSLARNFAIVDALPGIEQKFIHKHVALLGKRILIWSVASVQLQPRSHLARAQNGLLCSERVTYSFQFTIDTTRHSRNVEIHSPETNCRTSTQVFLSTIS